MRALPLVEHVRIDVEAIQWIKKAGMFLQINLRQAITGNEKFWRAFRMQMFSQF